MVNLTPNPKINTIKEYFTPTLLGLTHITCWIRIPAIMVRIYMSDTGGKKANPLNIRKELVFYLQSYQFFEKSPIPCGQL